MPYRGEFENWISSTFKNLPHNKSLFVQQSFVKEFMKDCPFHGILLYHGLGVGKTRSAIAICEARGKDVVILLPASIKDNFQNEIDMYKKQVGITSSIKYEFIHYNGLTQRIVTEIKSNKGFFKNKTVVIDEIHGFVSMVKNNSKNAERLYGSIMDAENVAVVALTGTPIVNTPEELLYVFNLVYGFINTYIIKFTKSANANLKLRELQNNDAVSTVRIMDDQITIQYTLFPSGFIRNAKKPCTVIKGEQSLDFRGKDQPKLRRDLLFPKPSVFRDLFISNGQVQNTKLFTRRLQGIVSYFKNDDTNQEYPKEMKLKIVKCEMTNRQFVKYFEMRNKEMNLEKNRNTNTSDDKKEPSLYKSYTRACCNFVFPKKIKRPFTKSQKLMIKHEMDEAYDDVDDANLDDATTNDNTFDDIKTVMKKLANSDFIIGDELAKSSPKMSEMIRRIQKSSGPVVVYSAFRNVEGVGIFKLVLDKHEYDELSVKSVRGKITLVNGKSPKPKYIVFTSNTKTNRILMDIFNNNVKGFPEELLAQLPDNFCNLHGEYAKVIMLTKSGSEGISLKNVRQVHIMEPYWNDNRVRQVIGRAVRAGSHKDLPEDERIVTPYIYLTHFNETQKDKRIIRIDAGLTTDEHIFSTAEKKAKVNDAFLQMMKEISIDCSIYSKNTKHCKKIPKTKDNIVYPLGPIEYDLSDALIPSLNENFKAYTVPNEDNSKQITDKRINPKNGLLEKVFYREGDMTKLYFKRDVKKYIDKRGTLVVRFDLTKNP